MLLPALLCSGQVEGGSQQITSGPSHLDFNLDQQQHNTTTLSVTSPGACLPTQSRDFTDSVSSPKGRKIRPAADISGLLVESAICEVTLNTQIMLGHQHFAQLFAMAFRDCLSLFCPHDFLKEKIFQVHSLRPWQRKCE